MKSNGLHFHHPIAFWTGTLALVAGVLAHIPMFVCASHMGYRMVGMPMDAPMMAGMALIPLGLLLAAYGLMPRFERMRATGKDTEAGDGALLFEAADGIPLNARHWSLVLVLVVALTIDVMKPATLGFVMPGMTSEYGLSKQNAGFLALVALTGTTVGSVLWGLVADRFGRRATILLSALMFIGTAICGAMPSFAWNLAMCFLMGASAGGLLPITFTMMAEMIPAAHRGWLLVALGGIGNSAGYLVAAGAASLLEPSFSWRVLWLLGLPTGAVIILLSRLLPESPRFLASSGLHEEARAVLARFGGNMRGGMREAALPPASLAAPAAPSAGLRELLRGGYAPLTIGMGVAGVAWGLANFGFLLWLPMNLRAMGMDAATATSLLARAAFLALPGTLLVIWLYHRWSSVMTLVSFIALSAASLLGFFLLGWTGMASTTALAVATCALLVSASGVIATLIPYAAEIYPVHLRASGSGLIGASSKLGGILGAGLGVAGLFADLSLSALVIAVPMLAAALLLARKGIDTRGRRLEEIQALLA